MRAVACADQALLLASSAGALNKMAKVILFLGGMGKGPSREYQTTTAALAPVPSPRFGPAYRAVRLNGVPGIALFLARLSRRLLSLKIV